MTENEAKGKTCHLSLIAVSSGVAYVVPVFSCCASQCMAWRWNKQNDGYCGLAGTDKGNPNASE